MKRIEIARSKFLACIGKLTIAEVANKYGCDKSTVYERLFEHGIDPGLFTISKECLVCHKSFPTKWRKQRYCGTTCQARRFRWNHPDKIKIASKKSQSKMIRAFHEYKRGIGCKKCGYNIFGGSLDYHHIDASEKDKSMSVADYYYKTALWKSEEPKCVLVCKNCHYELHNLIRIDKGSYDAVIVKIKRRTSVY